MSWLEDYGFDAILAEQEEISEQYLALKEKSQSDIIEFLHIHKNRINEISKDNNNKEYMSLVDSIMTQGLNEILSEKQLDVLCNFYAHNAVYICSEYHCEVCPNTESLNKNKFLLSLKETNLDIIRKIDKGSQGTKKKYILENLKEDDSYFFLLNSIVNEKKEWTNKQDYVVKKWILNNVCRQRK